MLMPFLTYGSFVGWQALTPYHTNEQEQALDIAPFYFAFAGGSMAVPSMSGVVLTLILGSVLHVGPAKDKTRAIARMAISTLAYAVFMALVYGISDGWMTAYGPMLQHQTQAYKRFFFMERVSVNLVFWPLINWIATLACIVVIDLVSRCLPRKVNRQQKWLAGVTPIIAVVLMLCPPWWAHDYLPLPSGDETTASYYEGYLGHAPLWSPPPVYKFMGAELYPGMCTQQMMLELLLLFSGAIVLWNVLAIKHLRWQLLNKLQRASLISGGCLVLIALICPPWWTLTGKGFFWGEREPMAFLGYAAIVNPPAWQHGRREIIWPLLALESSVIAICTGATFCWLKRRDREDDESLEGKQSL